MPLDTLSLPAAPSLKAHETDVHGMYVPIELENGCTEQGCTIDSDNLLQTNALRKHYLEHFGHRNLTAMLQDYSDHAVWIQVVHHKGSQQVERTTYRGREEIRQALERMWARHPTTDSTFCLHHVSIEAGHGMSLWSGETPTSVFPQGACTDTFVWNGQHQIVKQFSSYTIQSKNAPWYVEDPEVREKGLA